VSDWDTPDWPTTSGNPDAERFKWAWNEAQGELVWSVTGPGDGRPYHEEYLLAAWGREPSPAVGDVLGVATHLPGAEDGSGVVSVVAYFEAAVPANIAGWFRRAFPGAELRERGP
jgi:hypothetical protein